MKNNYTRLKSACYTMNMTMSVVGNLSPVLFLTFRTLYDVSYAMLGFLVLINYVTQLTVDLIFSFFSHRFNIAKAIKTGPILGAVGLFIYAVWPFIFPNAVYAGLVVGTIIFSSASGLAEVLLSPVIAAIPADDPDREMSKLHSVYAWGVVLVVIFSTLFLLVCGNKSWQWLALIFMLIPLTSAILFSGVEIPPMDTPERVSGALRFLRKKELWLCFAAIFLGGASELVMAQWSSSYLEQALGIPKLWGDVLGVAFFAVAMGLGRTLYSKIGKNITRALFLGAVGATVCYLITAISNIPFIGLIACAFTGFCVSMMWPGSLVIASDRIPDGGVFIFAMMAAGGDLGASVGPQLVGIITDAVIASPAAMQFTQNLSLAPDQLGMKIGMLVGMLFPLVGIPLYYHLMKTHKQFTAE
ncbi:MAG: MFS transporter [Clostridiales bacterium]|nr:MFS transporter [Clostridiales bacterium]